MAKGADNNFNLLRLVAAWLILFGHCYDLYDGGGGTYHDPVVTTLGLPGATFYALACFFTISGYLVTASWQREPGIIRYAKNRILRIFPALWVAVLLSTFIMGTLISSLPLADYLAHKDTWKYLRGMFVFGLRYDLPGVFDNVPYPHVVNGSLWSLKLELQCYVVLAVLGLTRLLRLQSVLLLTVLCFTGSALLYLSQNAPGAASLSSWVQQIINPKWSNILKFGFFFWAGSVCYFMHRSKHFLLPCIIAFAAYYAVPYYGLYIHSALLPTVILALALRVRIPTPAFIRNNDLSYGIYLYAFPLQQLYMEYIGQRFGIYGFMLGTTIAALCMAWLSWRLVEKPALRLKSRFKR